MTGISCPYRGYTISLSDGLGPPLAFCHGDFDGPGDTRYGCGDTIADCERQIDHQIADAMVQADVEAAGRARMAEGL
jgi:hypothetical protein